MQGLLVDEIREFLSANAHPHVAEKYSRYFTEGYHPYGTPPELISSKVKEIRARGIGLDEALDVAEELVSSCKYEETHFAIGLVSLMKETFTPDTATRIESWFDAGIRNWAHDDGLCSDILPILIDKGLLTTSRLKEWTSSTLKYKRRAVPVSLIKCFDRSVACEEALELIRPLMTDMEKVVQQGTGWFLREVWKKRPEPVEAMLCEFREIAPRLIYQYAMEKMDKKDRERFRRPAKNGKHL